MAKCYILLILLCSLIFVHSDLTDKCEGTASSAYECIEKYTEEERNSGYYCCYEKAKKGGVEISDCTPLSEDDVNDIKNYIGDIEDKGYKDVSVDCESYYLQLGIVSLLLILI